ncbi:MULTISPECIES: hypothetical protein [unclassified Paenibacillus]|nr:MULTISPECIES: hypothetical protein [unclassified Paenibacillus]
MDRAWGDVRKGITGDVPDHLKDAHYVSITLFQNAFFNILANEVC